MNEEALRFLIADAAVLEASFATEKAASAAAQAAIVGAALLAEQTGPGTARREPVKELPEGVDKLTPWAQEDDFSSCINGWDSRCDA